MRKVGKKAPRPFDRLAKAATEQSSRRVTNNITQALCNDVHAYQGNNFFLVSKNHRTFKRAMTALPLSK